MRNRRYTVVPLLLLIALVFVASQRGERPVRGPESAAMARPETK
jgi:hypothetical protein